jgi:hypothetical protein
MGRTPWSAADALVGLCLMPAILQTIGGRPTYPTVELILGHDIGDRAAYLEGLSVFSASAMTDSRSPFDQAS